MLRRGFPKSGEFRYCMVARSVLEALVFESGNKMVLSLSRPVRPAVSVQSVSDDLSQDSSRAYLGPQSKLPFFPGLPKPATCRLRFKSKPPTSLAEQVATLNLASISIAASSEVEINLMSS